MPSQPSSARSQASPAEARATVRTRPLKNSTAQSGFRSFGRGTSQAIAYASCSARTNPSENQSRSTSPSPSRNSRLVEFVATASAAVATAAAPMPNSLAAPSTLSSLTSSQKLSSSAPTSPIGSSQRNNR